MKGKISSIIRIVVSFGLLGFLFWLMRDEIRNIWSIISDGSIRFVVIGLSVFVINALILAYRLKIIFKGENLNITTWKAIQLTLIGFYFNNFMPTAVGGDIIKAHYAAGLNGKKVESYASVMMDRVIGLYTFLFVAAVALLVDRGQFAVPLIRPIVFCLLFAGVVGFVVLTNKVVAGFLSDFFGKIKMFRLGEKLNSFYGIVHDYRNRPDVIVKSLITSIVAQSLYFIAVYFFFLSLGKTVSLGNIFLIMPVVVFISMIPSLGGLGVREGAIVALFSPLVGKESAFAMSLLLLFGLFFLSIIGGIVNLGWGMKKAKGS